MSSTDWYHLWNCLYRWPCAWQAIAGDQFKSFWPTASVSNSMDPATSMKTSQSHMQMAQTDSSCPKPVCFFCIYIYILYIYNILHVLLYLTFEVVSVHFSSNHYAQQPLYMFIFPQKLHKLEHPHELQVDFSTFVRFFGPHIHPRWGGMEEPLQPAKI